LLAPLDAGHLFVDAAERLKPAGYGAASNPSPKIQASA
jgi:hypothetical protein